MMKLGLASGFPWLGLSRFRVCGFRVLGFGLAFVMAREPQMPICCMDMYTCTPDILRLKH